MPTNFLNAVGKQRGSDPPLRRGRVKIAKVVKLEKVFRRKDAAEGIALVTNDRYTKYLQPATIVGLSKT